MISATETLFTVVLVACLKDSYEQRSPFFLRGVADQWSPFYRPRQAGFPKFPISSFPVYKLQSQPSCGHRQVFHSPPKNLPDEPLPKIVGGTPVPYGAYPWTVHLETLSFSGFEHACGGALVSSLFVVTAAHCLHGFGTREVRIKVGDFDAKRKDLSERTFEVEVWRMHPDFQKGGLYNNDIAVVKIKPHLRKGVQFNQFVSPACLPTQGASYPPGTWCYISGWGLTDENAFYPSNLLRAAAVPLLPKEICRRNDVIGPKRFRKGMMCAGYLQGQIDACNGDSGGPLVCHVAGGIHVLLGVVSWGIDCARKNKPGVYSDVQFYLPFINKAIKEL